MGLRIVGGCVCINTLLVGLRLGAGGPDLKLGCVFINTLLVGAWACGRGLRLVVGMYVYTNTHTHTLPIRAWSCSWELGLVVGMHLCKHTSYRTTLDL